MQKLSAFVALNGRLDVGKVTYKINGQYVGEKSGSPYEISVDFKPYAGQTVNIIADVYSEDGTFISSKTISAKVGGNSSTPVIVEENATIKIVPSSHNITLNGYKVEMPCYNINGNNFFKLRDLGVVMSSTNAKFEVGFDGSLNKIVLQKGNNYFKLADLAKELDFNVNWNDQTNTIEIETANI